MAKLKDTEIDGNLYVSEDIQIGDISVTDMMTAVDELNTNVDTLNSSSKAVGQAFRYLGVLNESSDCNNCTQTGFYTISNKPTNGTASWCIMFVFAGEGGGIHQLSFAGGGLWGRSYTGSPLKWTEWTAHHNS